MKWWVWNAKICLACSSGDRAGHVSWISETALSISTISFLLRGSVRAIFYLMKCLFLFLSLHQSRCIVGLSILHDHLFQVENFPLSASSSLSLFPFYTDLIIASLEQLWLVVSQFVFHAGCPVIISCRLPKAGMFSDKFKGRLFLFHVCQFSLLGKYLLCQLV